jgi:hypothetical protein
MADSPPDRASGVGLGRRSPTGAPRWVKVFGIVVAVLVLLFVIMALFGGGPAGHGPGRHASS